MMSARRNHIGIFLIDLNEKAREHTCTCWAMKANRRALFSHLQPHLPPSPLSFSFYTIRLNFFMSNNIPVSFFSSKSMGLSTGKLTRENS